MIRAAIFALIIAWAPAKTPVDEPAEREGARVERLESIADALATVAHDPPGGLAAPSGSWIAAGVLTVWAAETHLDPYIHAGTPHPDPELHEDHGRARCLGSLHRTTRWTEAEWRALAGTSPEATTRCARATAAALRGAWWRCSRGRAVDVETLARTMEQYATGHRCEPGAESRRRGQAWLDVRAAIRGRK